MPVGAEPRVEVEAHRGPPPVRGPERLRANPAQLLEALERALHDPGLHPRPGRGHRGVVGAGDYFTMRR